MINLISRKIYFRKLWFMTVSEIAFHETFAIAHFTGKGGIHESEKSPYELSFSCFKRSPDYTGHFRIRKFHCYALIETIATVVTGKWGNRIPSIKQIVRYLHILWLTAVTTVYYQISSPCRDCCLDQRVAVKTVVKNGTLVIVVLDYGPTCRTKSLKY